MGDEGEHFRHSRCMRNLQFYVSGKRPLGMMKDVCCQDVGENWPRYKNSITLFKNAIHAPSTTMWIMSLNYHSNILNQKIYHSPLYHEFIVRFVLKLEDYPWIYGARQYELINMIYWLPSVRRWNDITNIYIFMPIFRIHISSTSCEIGHRWVPQNPVDPVHDDICHHWVNIG